MRMTLLLPLVLALVSLCAGCSNAVTTTAPTTTNGSKTDTFTSFLAIGARAFTHSPSRRLALLPSR